MFEFSSCIVILLISFVVFFYLRSHLLLMLMTLEFIGINMLFFLTNFCLMFLYDLSILVYIVIVLVCEAVMGLILLTLYVHSHGSDYFRSSSLLSC